MVFLVLEERALLVLQLSPINAITLDYDSLYTPKIYLKKLKCSSVSNKVSSPIGDKVSRRVL